MFVSQGCIRPFRLISLTLFLVLFAPAQAQAAGSTIPIKNFHRVAADLFRGGRPSEDGLVYLKSLGVKTILNLENSKTAVGNEMREAAALGIREISVPMGYLKPKDTTVDQALEVVGDPSLRPLYVHCAAGQDRTGIVMALARVEQEGWNAKDAYKEMMDFGFHKILFWMSAYVRKRLGI